MDLICSREEKAVGLAASKHLYNMRKGPWFLEVVKGERVDFYFRLQPHCLSPSSTAAQWWYLVKELHGSVILLVLSVCGEMIHGAEET